MGWKNVKEHYRIKHIVCTTQDGIAIGSPFIQDIIVIGHDGTMRKGSRKHAGVWPIKWRRSKNSAGQTGPDRAMQLRWRVLPCDRPP